MHAINFGADVALGSASKVMGGESSVDEVTPYHDEEHGDGWDLADGPVDPPAYFRNIIRQGIDTICYLCRLANMDVPEDGSSVFSMAGQNINSM